MSPLDPVMREMAKEVAKALSVEEREARAFRWLARRIYQGESHIQLDVDEDGWQVYSVEEGYECLYKGKEFLEAVEAAMKSDD